jgi:hypothetical protein
MLKEAEAMIERLDLHDVYEGALLETTRDEGISRPRVRPVVGLPRDIRIEFPRRLREEYPIGTRFRATVKVCQKTKNGLPHGPPYLRADEESIYVVSEFKPNRRLFAVLRPGTISGRAYDYIYDQQNSRDDPLNVLRKAAYAAAKDLLDVKLTTTVTRERSDTIRWYALMRSNGICEGCKCDAPFITKDGRPYLEVHHLSAVAQDGADHPGNVAALCPNCHRRVEHGADATAYNNAIRTYIGKLER